MFRNKEDLLFWTGVMRDHAIFFTSTLSPKEVPYIQKAVVFKDFFQGMLDKIKNEDDLEINIPSLLNPLNDFINYKRNVLKGLLTCKLEISLPPTFINHQINEALEFKFELTSPEKYMQCIEDPMCFIDLVKKWIADASGHAATYSSQLDPTESVYIEKSLAFKKTFDMLSVKANELQMMMMRSGAGNPAMMLLTEEVANLLKEFIAYLKTMFELRSNCKVMAAGTLTPLLPDHMIREHMHALDKIDEFMKRQKG